MFVIIPDVLKTVPDIEQKVFGVDTEILGLIKPILTK